MKSLNRLSQKLFSPTDAASLGMFRILFGALMIWQVFYYLAKDRYLKYFVEPAFHFTYYFFPFVSPVSERFLFWALIVTGVAALGITLGLFYRLSALIFFLGFSYIFLLDKTYYNNHYYAIILLSFILLTTNAQRWASLDQKIRPRPEVIPYWQLFLLKAQIFIIYFYGGIAKLNGDWLAGEPMRTWLHKHSGEIPFVGNALTAEWAVYFFSWGGLAFDLGIGFLLWWRKTRFWAFLAVLFFNLTNSVIFQIGVFPFLMIGAATLFDDPDWPRSFFKLKAPPPRPEDSRASDLYRPAALFFVLAYLSVQLLVPLRHWLIPGNVSWTEEGHLFSWHMKLRDKRGRIKIWVTDPKDGNSFQVDPSEELSIHQLGKMMQRPQFIHQYVQYLKENLKAKGLADPIIRVDSQISLNARPFQPAIDPNINLAEAQTNPFGADSWILPLDPRLKPGTLPPAPPEAKDPPEGGGSSETENW